MKSPQSTYPLRLPRSVKAEVERRAKADGISINQFVATAVSEKLAAMNTAASPSSTPCRSPGALWVRSAKMGRLTGAAVL